MHAYLISGSDPEAIGKKVHSLLTEWHVSGFDTFIIEKEVEKKEISIMQIREMTKQLSLSPANSPFTAAVIKDAHLMTIPAQNAILKILEEPPIKAKIILTSNMTDALLQTIISRCEKCTVGTHRKMENVSSITLASLFSMEEASVSKTLLSIDRLTISGQDAMMFVDHALQILYTAISSNNTSPYGPEKCSNLVRKLLKTRIQLSSNVNQKLALDCCFL